MVRDVSEAPLVAPDDPELVYHYTDPWGLFGIIKDKILWASDVWFMNDAREALYGLGAIERALEALDVTTGTSNEVRNRTLGLLRGIRTHEEFWHSYITCLSFLGDDLSQWRAYGRPRGFSIGFDAAQLRGLCASSPELGKPTFRRVEYDETQQTRVISIMFNIAVASLSEAATGEQLQDAAAGLLNAALILAPALKHPAFSSEREVRLHIFRETNSTTGVLFRPSAMGIVPYVNIDFKASGADMMTLIREVIVGPQANELESQRSVRQFLAHHGLRDVEVRLSKIPLRPA
jgi:hypothetical protein